MIYADTTMRRMRSVAWIKCSKTKHTSPTFEPKLNNLCGLYRNIQQTVLSCKIYLPFWQTLARDTFALKGMPQIQ